MIWKKLDELLFDGTEFGILYGMSNAADFFQLSRL